MGYTELEQRIKADFQREVDKLNRESQREIRKINDEADKTARQAAEKVKVSGERKAALKYRQITGSAKLKAMQKLSAEKNHLIDEVFNRVEEQILALPESRKEKLLDKMMKDAVLIDGEKTIKVDKKYSKLLKDGEGYTVVAQDLGDFGIIIESADGSIKVDNLLNTVLSRAKVKMRPQVSKLIFG